MNKPIRHIIGIFITLTVGLLYPAVSKAQHNMYKDANMNAPASVVSVRGIAIPSIDRGEDLLVRISAPATGNSLPVIIFSHGHGSSMDGYTPLTDYWASRGYIVIQPTHLDSKRLALSENDIRKSSIWEYRVADIKLILNNLDLLEKSLPGLEGRMDSSRIVTAGHSFGGQTTELLLGARMIGGKDMSDKRIKAGLLLAAGGNGGESLSAFAKEHLPYLDMEFSHMTTPTLVVVGDKDSSPLTVRGPEWYNDTYYLSPGAKAMLTLFDAEHMLGGISGYEVTETTDENPKRVALIQKMSLAFFNSQLYSDSSYWSAACEELKETSNPLGRVECK